MNLIKDTTPYGEHSPGNSLGCLLMLASAAVMVWLGYEAYQWASGYF